MLDKNKVVEILRVGRPVYKVNIDYINSGDILLNLVGTRVGIMRVWSSKLGGYLHAWDCSGLIKCLITKPDEDIYMWYDDDGRVEFMFGDKKYLDLLPVEDMEMWIDKSSKLWVDEWNYINEEVLTW